jgi:hypothetical protein
MPATAPRAERWWELVRAARRLGAYAPAERAPLRAPCDWAADRGFEALYGDIGAALTVDTVRYLPEAWHPRVRQQVLARLGLRLRADATFAAWAGTMLARLPACGLPPDADPALAWIVLLLEPSFNSAWRNAPARAWLESAQLAFALPDGPPERTGPILPPAHVLHHAASPTERAVLECFWEADFWHGATAGLCAFLRAMYAETQAWFAAAGVTRLQL